MFLFYKKNCCKAFGSPYIFIHPAPSQLSSKCPFSGMSVSWTVLDEGSFASIRARLPPNTSLKTETDAVVSMSGGLEVSGHMTGGIIGSIARLFFSNESFFTTLVKNDSESNGDVLLAPSDPGGICLHRLGPGDSIMLTKGSYVASDNSVEVNTVTQREVVNSLLSGTGPFLMKASGRGIVAIASYGSIHKYTLLAGERRMVDNGHLAAWTADMSWQVKMVSRSVWGSVSSGEGLMCEFIGPGTVYIQSHKARIENDKNSLNNRSGIPLMILTIIFIVFILMFACVMIFVIMPEKQYGNDPLSSHNYDANNFNNHRENPFFSHNNGANNFKNHREIMREF